MDLLEYQALIDDTLTYIRGLLPSRKEMVKVTLPPLPEVKERAKAQPKKTRPAPMAPPIAAKAKPFEKKESKTFIELQLLSKPIPEPTEGIRALFKELDPSLYVHREVPSDTRAKRIKDSWKEKRGVPTIPILFQGREYRSFVMQIAKAIDTVFTSCRLVEMTPNKKWDQFLESENLKLIVVPDAFIFGSQELLPFYQENPQQKTRKLGKVPLLLLPDLSLYYKDPYLKRSLWTVISNTITSMDL